MGNLFEWLADHAWVAWAVLAAALAAIEVLTLDLLFLMLAAGALAGAVAAAVGAGSVISIVVALVTSVAMLGAVRPIALRHLKQGPELRSGPKALEGRQGVVVERVDAHHGQVKIDGELWSARSYDQTSTIEPGKTVDVFQIDGATAYVHEVDKPWEL